MGRPPLPIGGHGKVNTTDLTPDAAGTKKDPKTFESRCRLKDRDGSIIQLRRSGQSRTAAENALQKRITELLKEIRGGQFDASTRFSTLAESWLGELEDEAARGTVSHDTVRLYRGSLKNHINPRLGALRVGVELTGTALDRLVRDRHDRVGYPTARTVRAVLRGVCAYAVRHGALKVDLSKSIGRLVEGDKKEIRALTPQERKDLIVGLGKVAIAHRTDKLGRSLGTRAQVWEDLPDLVRVMLSTGVRLGELLALVGSNFYRDDGQPKVLIEARIVREHGQLVRKAYRKGSKNILILAVPDWSVAVWNRRKLAVGAGPMFGSVGGGFVHPTNMGHRLREAFDEAGFDWVTSHVFRKTVAAALDEAGLPTRHIADQLGHANEATTRKHYVAPRAGNLAAVAALEGMVE